jgi:hypothetical protein
MIVYNVKRRFFDMKAEAEAYRRAEGLSPAATAKLEIADRAQLAALLNALCEPPASGAPAGVPAEIVDRAFVAADFDIPKFLRDSWSRVLGHPL